ncbi:MAG: translation elongation factor Ts, partial [Gemmataceae bacterium]
MPRVLIADDNQQNAELLEAHLDGTGWETQIAVNGEETLKLTKEWTPDVILLDVMMPKFSGFEVCKRLRADAATKGVGVIMVTALDQPNDIERAIEDLRKNSGLKAAKKAGRTAAEGAVVTRVADDGRCGVMLEVNSETDFVARDDNFKAFAEKVVAKVFETRSEDVAALMDGELETAREQLVQKIGENISVRRAVVVEAPADGVVGAYVHSGRIGVLTQLK